tara:strand:+ start:55 stop:492 length:438 start_codon:yes stop_codon:yes gene_type:complete
MLTFAKYICFLFIGLILAFISIELESDFLYDFHESNLVIILITLFAINASTITLVLSKLKDLGNEKKFDFHESFQEIKCSITEQVILICLAILFSILAQSTLIEANFEYNASFFLTLNSAILISAIYILKDTANSLLIVLGNKDD